MARILVVDDEPDIREVLALLLDASGHQTTTAPDGESALAVLRSEPFDIVLLDVMMPKADGFAVLRAMRKNGVAPDVRVVMVTAKTSERDFVRGLELGADEFVTKPFDPGDLLATIDRLLATSDAERRDRRSVELEKAQLLHQLESTLR